MRTFPLLELMAKHKDQIPFAYKQASGICNYYQLLLGDTFYPGNTNTVIKHIVVTPYERKAKETFLRDFIDGSRNEVEVDSFTVYDVVVIGQTIAEDPDFVVEHLRTFLLNHNMEFNPDRY